MATVHPMYEATDGPEDPGLPDDLRRRKELLDRVYSLDELLTKETEQARPLLGDFLRVGEVTIIGGHGGQGKSTMSLGMGHAVATGGEFLGAECEEPKTVLFVDLEQGVGVAQRAVMKAFYPKGYREGEPVTDLVRDMDFGPHADNVLWADWPEGAGADGWDVLFDTLEVVLQRHQPALVVLDPVYKLMLGRNTNEAEVVGGLIHRVMKAKKACPDAAWLIPMHPRKPAAVGANTVRMHDLYGSAQWSWWASLIFMIWRGAGRETNLRIEKDRMGRLMLEDWKLDFLEGEGYERRPEEAEVGGGASLASRIWRLLQDNPSRAFTRKEMARILDAPEESVRNTTQKMVRKMRAGTGYRELLEDKGRSNRAFYSYTPPRPEPIIDAVKEQFAATEEDEW